MILCPVKLSIKKYTYIYIYVILRVAFVICFYFRHFAVM